MILRIAIFTYFTFCFFIIVSFFPVSSAHAQGKKKKVYVYDATSGSLKKDLEIERLITRGIVEEYIQNNKDLELNIVDDLKQILKQLNIDNKNINEAGALEIAETSLSYFFLSMSLSKENGKYILSLKLRDIKAKKNIYSQTVDFKSVKYEAKEVIVDASRDMFEERKLDSNLFLAVNLCYLHPAQDLGDIVYPGPGISFKFGIDNIFINYFSLAVESGYFRFSYIENTSDTISFIPFFLCSGYRFPVLHWLGFTPFVGAGVTWIIAYHGSGKGFNLKTNSQTTSLEEVLKAGLEIDVSISQSASIILDTNYTFVFEEKRLDFINIGLGIKIKL
ncbi:MAG: autotransporter outer membrane beta-barrel domain-containing protein [bacterium]|nr:autotransporter outer membrane beta-barrel domain-containing protein [bacterium]